MKRMLAKPVIYRSFGRWNFAAREGVGVSCQIRADKLSREARRTCKTRSIINNFTNASRQKDKRDKGQRGNANAMQKKSLRGKEGLAPNDNIEFPVSRHVVDEVAGCSTRPHELKNRPKGIISTSTVPWDTQKNLILKLIM